MSLDKVNKNFVISLERRKDRWFEFYRKSKEACITEYEKWDASDGQSIKLDDEVRFLFRNDTYKIKRGVIGCAMSHYKLWKHCYENNIDNILVFEDDVFFTEKKKTIEIWNKIVAPCISEETEFLFPSSPELCGIIRGGKYKIKDRLYKANEILERTFAYFITLKGIKILLDDIEKNGINTPIDRYLQSKRKVMTTHVCKVKLFSSPVLYKSDIQHDNEFIKMN